MTSTVDNSADLKKKERRKQITRNDTRKEFLAAMSDSQKAQLARLSPENREKYIALMLDREDRSRKMRDVLYADSKQRRIDDEHVKKLLGGVVLAKLKKEPKFFSEHLTEGSIPERERYLIHRFWSALWPDAVKPIPKPRLPKTARQEKDLGESASPETTPIIGPETEIDSASVVSKPDNIKQSVKPVEPPLRPGQFRINTDIPEL